MGRRLHTMKKVFQMTVTAFLSVILCVLFARCDFDFDFSDDGSDNNQTPGNPSSPAVYYIGDTATNKDNVEFVVVSVTDTDKIGLSQTESNFIVVTIKITNKGSESWSQNPNNCVLLLGDAEYKYNSATYYLENSMSGLTEINPNISKTAQIAFETPTKSTEDIYSIRLTGYSFFDQGVTIVPAEK